MAYRKDLCAILEREFTLRKKRNLRYSLRAFARDLEVSPSQLSLMLRGKRGISTERASRIAQVLGFTTNESEYFRALAEAAHARSSFERLRAARTVESIRPAATDGGFQRSIQVRILAADVDEAHRMVLDFCRRFSERFAARADGEDYGLRFDFFRLERPAE